MKLFEIWIDEEGNPRINLEGFEDSSCIPAEEDFRKIMESYGIKLKRKEFKKKQLRGKNSHKIEKSIKN
jgi:hypothetical protein